MAQLAQGSGGGWTASKLVGGQGRRPIIGQKLLRGNGKSYHDRQYEKGLSYA